MAEVTAARHVENQSTCASQGLVAWDVDEQGDLQGAQSPFEPLSSAASLGVASSSTKIAPKSVGVRERQAAICESLAGINSSHTPEEPPLPQSYANRRSR